MEIEKKLYPSLLLVTFLIFPPSIYALNPPSTLLINRYNNGDTFVQQEGSVEECTEETCVGLSSGTATGVPGDLCTCRCHPHLPAFREDLRICVDDIHECVLAPFVGGSTSQQIPFVFLPLKGQIIHPSKDISFAGIQTPVCAVSSAKFMTESGWVELRNPVDTDVPFRLFRDEGRTFLQWVGDPDLRNKMAGRLVLVYLMCRDLANTGPPDKPSEPTLFSPCVSFRVVGSPTRYLNNVSEVAFVSDPQADKSSSDNEHLSVSEYVAIGICSVLLGLIYVASVFLYLHLRKRTASCRSDKAALENQSLGTAEEGVIKNNPLLSISAHFSPPESAYSDTNSSDTEAPPDIIQNHDDRKKHMQITSAMIHSQKLHYNANCHRSSFSSLEHTYQDSTTNERLPEENVSIVETLEGREEHPDNLRALSGNTRKKLYFNPAYFEPQLLMAPPPAALEFLAKIREVIAIAKQKMAAKRFTPSLLNIPEEENQYMVEPSQEFSRPISRRGSAISLKRENSRRRTCTGCPGCEPQDLKSLSGKLPEFPSLGACHNCVLTPTDSKQISIRKWLEDVPILRAHDPSTQDVTINSLKSLRNPKRLRSPTRSLPSQHDDREGALSPRPASEKALRRFEYHQHRDTGSVTNPQNEIPTIFEQNISPSDAKKSDTKEENYYDLVPEEDKREVTMSFPPPDMIHEAMAVDKSEEVATLTKKQMKAVINEFTVQRNLILPAVETTKVKNGPIIDYETDSLERSSRNKGGYSTPTEYAEVSSSQASPTLSTALPDQEEMTMRNAIFNKNTGNTTISKINMDILREDDHDYELVVMKKGSVIDPNLYKLPELLQRNNGYSLVSEVYVNNGYNYGSTPSSPGSSNCSTLDGTNLKVKYDEGNEKPGKLLIEVEDCADHYIPVNDSDGFEPDTLDRKANKLVVKPNIAYDDEFIDSLDRKHQILLRTTGSFKKNTITIDEANVKSSNFNRAFGSLREIYEAKTRVSLKQFEETVLPDQCKDEGRILTLEERHSKRQRAKSAVVQPDVIPPPPHDGSPIYEHPGPPRKIITGKPVVKPVVKPPLPPKNSKVRGVGNNRNGNTPPSTTPTVTPDTPDFNPNDYEFCLIQKSKKNGNITNLIQTENVIVNKKNDQFILHTTNHLTCRLPLKSLKLGGNHRCRSHAWQNTLRPEDSGYLSSDSNESRLIRPRNTLDPIGGGSETDESLGDGHSESGAESVETHSVFFGRYHRKPVNCGGFWSVDSDVLGGDDGHSTTDSETVSYTTVIPVSGRP